MRLRRSLFRDPSHRDRSHPPPRSTRPWGVRTPKPILLAFFPTGRSSLGRRNRRGEFGFLGVQRRGQGPQLQALTPQLRNQESPRRQPGKKFNVRQRATTTPGPQGREGIEKLVELARSNCQRVGQFRLSGRRRAGKPSDRSLQYAVLMQAAFRGEHSAAQDLHKKQIMTEYVWALNLNRDTPS